eukprot:TRINITY_DN4636_c0_g6_i1.p1 TRINITY_DN4636_c0_g6~~TRINITY_DN4636_c0_g6_i1.p1  ORF type:complete len:560 (+),score=133.16 TRINITY_DN4636_c0_g6_i1:191-1681(+)
MDARRQGSESIRAVHRDASGGCRDTDGSPRYAPAFQHFERSLSGCGPMVAEEGESSGESDAPRLSGLDSSARLHYAPQSGPPSARRSSGSSEQQPRTLPRRVSFGDVVIHEEALKVLSRPPNSMRIAGDEWTYTELVSAMRGERRAMIRPPSALPFKDRKQGLRTLHRSFRGSDVVDWLQAETGARSREEAVCTAQTLLTRRVLEPCDHVAQRFRGGDELYRLWEDSRHVHGHRRRSHVLNGQVAWVGAARSPVEVVDDLIVDLMEIYNRNNQNLDSIRRSSSFRHFVERSAELQQVQLSLLADDQERTACFLNIHNTLALHAHVVQSTETKCRDTFFKKLCYNVGGEVFTLSDIEFGILGGNTHRSRIDSAQFSRGDPRKRWSLSTPVPEACLAASHLCNDSVPVQAYGRDGLAAQLEGVCGEALNRSVRITPDGIVVPRRCKEALGGLGGKGALDFVKKHVNADLCRAITRCGSQRLLFGPGGLEPTRPLVCAF